MSSNNPDLYMKIERNVVVTERKVKLSDIAKFECIDKNIINHINTITVLTFPKERVAPYVVSVLKIIEMIHEIYPNITVNNEGETSFVINLKEKEPAKCIKIIKALFVCMIAFFGASFSIMTFNNDVGLDTMFIQLYSLMTGYESSGFTVLEISYSLGIGVGILIFFNHFKYKKAESDPTPIQVEMEMYEEDLETALIDTASRKGEIIDVD